MTNDERERAARAAFAEHGTICAAARASGWSTTWCRKKLGLESSQVGRPKRTEWPSDLGQVPDPVIARREGVSKQCVRQWRLAQDPPVPAFVPGG